MSKKSQLQFDAAPCKLSAAAAQDNNELPISQNPENPEQLVNETVEPLIDQQESIHSETTDEGDKPGQVVNEKPEELKNPDVPQDI